MRLLTEEELKQILTEKIATLSWFSRLKLRLGGTVYLGHYMKSGWRAPLPFYAFRCPTHGIRADYPHGFGDILHCPDCLNSYYGEDAL
ncbi:MAG: hypothetical protein JRD89_00985 [Deltaproteobacteria bacterium]|nr:hypothetical protein [Deltaproteobacteria bacterium]